jgi:hypothetical protein
MVRIFLIAAALLITGIAHAGSFFGGGPGKDMSGSYTPPPSAGASYARPINATPAGRPYDPNAPTYIIKQHKPRRK